MKTLLFFPKLEPHKDYHYMPITALAVAAELLAQGQGVLIWDDRVDCVNERNLGLLVSGADQVMISAFTGYQLSEAYRIAKDVKEVFPEKKVIIGGPHATALPQQTLDSPYIDEVVQGEVDTGEHPLPYWLIDIPKYVNPETKRFIYVSSYGCPGVCTFCATKKRRKLVLLPLDKVERDIDDLMSLYQFKECVMFDATVFTYSLRALIISKIMRKHRLSWVADARAVEIIKEPNLDVLTESGLKQLTIGLESGSPRIIERMKKGNNHLEYFRQAAKKLKQFPLKMVSGVVFGTPGETVEDLRQTIDYIMQIREINPGFQISTTFFKPLPDTLMSDMCKEYGYHEPQSLEEWALLGEKSHYNYNQWADSPWIVDPDKYQRVYEDFRSENKELFV